jgi:uncharacterized protein (UPF0276 family)
MHGDRSRIPSTRIPNTQNRSAHGYGLRVPHYAELLERGPRGDLLEAITENFIGRGGRARAVLERVRRDADIALHGVSLSLGGSDPLNEHYLRQLHELERAVQPRVVSDHLCFGTVAGHYAHDLWPLPYTEEAIRHVSARIARVQDRLQRQIAIENVSSYIEYQASEMSEQAFLVEVAKRADCLVLLDVNNIVVSAKNHGLDAHEYLAAIPVGRVAQLHLAGHTDYGTHAIDDHGSAVPDVVWELYDAVVQRFGQVPAIVEWDEGAPTLAQVEEQSALARQRERSVLDRTVSESGVLGRSVLERATP